MTRRPPLSGRQTWSVLALTQRHRPPLVAVVHPVEVLDHGTGLTRGPALRLGIGPVAAAAIASGWPMVEGEALRFHLEPLPDAGLVAVSVGERPAGSVAREDVPAHLLGRITQQLLDRSGGGRALHAGAAVDATGRAVAVVGASGAGKSTLVAHLAGHPGWRLVNDEQLVVLDTAGLIAGFTRPVAIKATGTDEVGALLDRRGERPHPDGGVQHLTAEDLRTSYALAGRPALIVLPEVRLAAAIPGWEAVTPGEALVELAANALDLERDTEGGLRALAELAASTPTVRLRYRHATDAARTVRELLAAPRTGPLTAWHLATRGPAPEPADGSPERDGQIQVSRRTLAIEIGAEVVLVHTRTRKLALLAGAGAAAWLDRCWAAPHQGAAEDFVRDLLRAGFLTGPAPCLSCG